MKAIYNLVTFLAAVVVLGWAGFCVYSHWDILMAKAQSVAKPAAAKPIPVPCKPCCKHCTCGKTDCTGGDNGAKCCGGCGCADKDCCKK